MLNVWTLALRQGRVRPRRTHLHSRRRPNLLLIACVVALLTPVGLAWAASINYVVNGYYYDLDWGQTVGTANRTYNEVWRPMGFNFKLFYSGDTTGKSGTGNPLLDTRSWSSAHAACQNQSGTGPISPVTCQTDGA